MCFQAALGNPEPYGVISSLVESSFSNSAWPTNAASNPCSAAFPIGAMSTAGNPASQNTATRSSSGGRAVCTRGARTAAEPARKRRRLRERGGEVSIDFQA